MRLALSLSLLLCACSPATAPQPEAGSATGSAARPAASAAAPRLLITSDQLAAMRRQVEQETPAWRALRDNVDANMAKVDIWMSSAENVALAYLLTGEQKYSDAALRWARTSMEQPLSADSYLAFGDQMRRVALVLDWCDRSLSETDQKELADYLDASVHELWFANKGSGWGLADPGNNYHMSFVEGTAYSAYALARVGHPKAESYLALLRDKIEGKRGVLAYLRQRGGGGDWHEGTNYGQLAKQHLFSALSLIAAAGDKNYFQSERFFADSLVFAVYQLQPDRRSLHPAGDLSRESAMLASPYDRDYVQMASYWLDDAAVKALGRWYLEHGVSSYKHDSFDFRGGYYKELVFAQSAPVRAPDQLALWYRTGSGLINLRSGWDERATSITVMGNRRVDQSHAHLDVGSFTLFKSGWQAVDAATFSSSGLLWEAGAHNMVHVDGHGRYEASLGGLESFRDSGGLAYLRINASGLFQARASQAKGPEPLLDEYTRELIYLRPNTLVIYDRVAPKSAETHYQYRMHFAAKPTQATAGVFRAQHEAGGIALAVVDGGQARVVPDTDLAEGPSKAWRVEVPGPAGSGRFLTVTEAAIGAPPKLIADRIESDDALAGVAVGGHVVVFSQKPRGEAVGGFSYRVAGTDRRTHVLANLDQPVDVRVETARGRTEVTVTPGSRYRPQDGVVVVR